MLGATATTSTPHHHLAPRREASRPEYVTSLRDGKSWSAADGV